LEWTDQLSLIGSFPAGFANKESTAAYDWDERRRMVPAIRIRRRPQTAALQHLGGFVSP
jgi:hypothetical protein